MAPSDHPKAGAVAPEGRAADLLHMLKQDHVALLECFNTLQQCDKSQRTRILELYGKMAQQLQMHMEGEERFLYTALEPHEEVRKLVLEGFEEHYLAKQLVTALQTMAVDDERWGAKLAVLRRVTEAHMIREEEAVFSMAGSLLGEGEMQGILQQILRLKRDKITS